MITVVFTKILLLKTYQMRSLLIDWLLGNNYLRKRFCYFIFMSRQVICLFIYIFVRVFFCGRVAKKESRLKFYCMSFASPIFVYFFYALN